MKLELTERALTISCLNPDCSNKPVLPNRKINKNYKPVTIGQFCPNCSLKK